MTPLILFLIAAWVWFCLVFAKKGHMRIAITLPFFLVAAIVVSVPLVLLEKAHMSLKLLAGWVSDFGHGKGGGA